MIFCIYCGKHVDCETKTSPDTFVVRGTLIEYDRVSAHCPICKREIYIPDIHDQNCMNREKAYKRFIEVKNG